MLKFYVDFNHCEDVDAVIVRTDLHLNAINVLSDSDVGRRVIVYDESLECEANLKRGQYADWVAVIDRSSLRDVPESQWGRLDL
jgi:hypothetical protein